MDNKDKIIEGAAELFRRYGMKPVTMDMIASHLGISKRTIYELFADKDELIMGVLGSMARKQRNLVEMILGESENAITAIFRIIELNIEHFQTMNPMFHEDIKRFHREVLAKKEVKCEMPDYKNNQQVIERGIREKHFRKDINPEIVNKTLYYMVLSVMNSDLYPFEAWPRKEVVKNTLVNFLKGIATAEGLELIQKLEKKL